MAKFKFTDPGDLAMFKVINERNKNKNFIKRGLNPESYPVLKYQYEKDGNTYDSEETHRMSNSHYLDENVTRYKKDSNGTETTISKKIHPMNSAFPTIFQEGNQLIRREPNDDEYIILPSQSMAEKYAENGLIDHNNPLVNERASKISEQNNEFMQYSSENSPIQKLKYGTKDMKTKKYNLGVQKVDVSPGSQGNEKFLYGNQYGQMGAGLGGTLGSGIGMIAGGPMGAQVGKLAGTALGYGAGYLFGNQKGKQIATEMDVQRGNELNINKSIDYQNDNFSGKDMYQDKKMFENTGYLDNKQLYAKYGLKNAPKEKIEVEKDEMIFRKDPKNGRTMLVADFKGGQPHSKGGEDFLAQDGDVIYPGKMRDQIKALVGQDGYVTDERTFEAYRQQLPEDNESQEMKCGTKKLKYGAKEFDANGKEIKPWNPKVYHTYSEIKQHEDYLKSKALADQKKYLPYIKEAKTMKGHSLSLNNGNVYGVSQYGDYGIPNIVNGMTPNYLNIKNNKEEKDFSGFEYEKANQSISSQLPKKYSNQNNQVVNTPQERFTMKDGKFLDSQYNGKITDTDRLAFKEWLGKQNQDIQRQYYKDNVAKPELPIQSGEDMSRDDIAFQMENEAPFSKAATKSSFAQSPFTEKGYMEYINTPEFQREVSNSLPGIKPYLRENQNEDIDKELGKKKLKCGTKKLALGDGDFTPSQQDNTPIIPSNYFDNTIYGVNTGDSWQSIANKSNVGKNELMVYNNNMPINPDKMRTNPYQLAKKKELGFDILHPGEKIRIPNKFNPTVSESQGNELGYKGEDTRLGTQLDNPENMVATFQKNNPITPFNPNYKADNQNIFAGGSSLGPGSTGGNFEYNPNSNDKPFDFDTAIANNPQENNNLNDFKNVKNGVITNPDLIMPSQPLNAASKVASNTSETTTPATTPDSKSSFLNMIPNIIGTGANMLYAHGLTKERPEKRDATRVQLEQMKYQDRSNPQRYQNLLGSKLAMKNATNYAGGSINNLLGASAMSNAAYQQQANQIEQGESGVAMGIDQQNVGIKNQQNILNGQYFDQNKTANEMNDARTRDIQRQGRLGMATTANQSIQNAQTLQKDNLMQKESDRRYGLQEKLYGNQLKMANEQTEAQDYSTYASLISYRDKYAENDPRRAEIDMLLKRFQKKYNFTNL